MASTRRRFSDAPLIVWFLVVLVAFGVGVVATLLFVGLPPDATVLTAALLATLAVAAAGTAVLAVVRRRRHGRSFGAAVSAAVRARALPARIDQSGWQSALRRRQLVTVAFALIAPASLLALAVPGVFIAQNADDLRAWLYWAVTLWLVVLALVAATLLVRRFLTIRELLADLHGRRADAVRRTR